jgi:hypothetical protein
MVDEFEILREKGIENIEELIGYVTSIGKYIEWGTGKLIDKRQRLKKKQVALKYDDLLEIYGCSRTKLGKMLKTMYDNEIITHTNEGYFISSNFFKKGKK